eukprot:5804378-Pyramimonas_sp.AAC.1
MKVSAVHRLLFREWPPCNLSMGWPGAPRASVSTSDPGRPCQAALYACEPGKIMRSLPSPGPEPPSLIAWK